jgi:hypothetical protein
MYVYFSLPEEKNIIAKFVKNMAFGTSMTNQNFIFDEVKGTLNFISVFTTIYL